LATYPDMKNSFLMRAVRRKTHFMKTFKEVRNIYLLLAKDRKAKGVQINDDGSSANLFDLSDMTPDDPIEATIDSMLIREYRTFKKESLQQYKQSDIPLRDRIEMMEKAVQGFSTDELEKLGEFATIQERINRDSQIAMLSYVNVRMLMQLNISLVKNTAQIFKIFFRHYEDWLGGYIFKGNKLPYEQMRPFALNLLTTSFSRVQQARSQSLQAMKKHQIWHSKLSQELYERQHKLVLKHNMSTDTLEELRAALREELENDTTLLPGGHKTLQAHLDKTNSADCSLVTETNINDES